MKIKKKEMLIILLIILIIPIVLLARSEFGFIDVEDSRVILGYFGSIIGGIFALGGVFLTIKFEKEKHNDDLSVQYKPHLELKKLFSSAIDNEKLESNYCNLIYNFSNDKDNLQKECGCVYSFIINKGRGEAINVTFDLSVSDNCCYKFQDLVNCEKSKTIDYVASEDKITILFNFYELPSNYEDFEIKLNYSYYDLFEKNIYEGKNTFEVKKSINNKLYCSTVY